VSGISDIGVRLRGEHAAIRLASITGWRHLLQIGDIFQNTPNLRRFKIAILIDHFNCYIRKNTIDLAA
jgi:hypothetical protein